MCVIRRFLVKQAVTTTESVRAQLPLEIVDVSFVGARISCRRQNLQPDCVQLQSSQPKHPLQRHRKIAATLAILRRKPAPEENCHPEKKQKKHRTSNAELPISNSKRILCIGHWMLKCQSASDRWAFSLSAFGSCFRQTIVPGRLT